MKWHFRHFSYFFRRKIYKMSLNLHIYLTFLHYYFSWNKESKKYFRRNDIFVQKNEELYENLHGLWVFQNVVWHFWHFSWRFTIKSPKVTFLTFFVLLWDWPPKNVKFPPPPIYPNYGIMLIVTSGLAPHGLRLCRATVLGCDECAS